MSAIETALRTALRANTALMAAAPGGVHQDVAPAAVSAPHVIYTLLSAPHDYVLGAAYAEETASYLVKGIANSITVADTLAGLIQTVMATPLTIAGVTVVDQIRVERVAYREAGGGGDWFHRGGVYRLTLDHV